MKRIMGGECVGVYVCVGVYMCVHTCAEPDSRVGGKGVKVHVPWGG